MMVFVVVGLTTIAIVVLLIADLAIAPVAFNGVFIFRDPRVAAHDVVMNAIVIRDFRSHVIPPVFFNVVRTIVRVYEESPHDRACRSGNRRSCVGPCG